MASIASIPARLSTEETCLAENTSDPEAIETDAVPEDQPVRTSTQICTTSSHSSFCCYYQLSPVEGAEVNVSRRFSELEHERVGRTRPDRVEAFSIAKEFSESAFGNGRSKLSEEVSASDAMGDRASTDVVVNKGQKRKRGDAAGTLQCDP
ncbi:uncharacterized protein K460DRAFT_406682 [Cucurbitaria berberidis CBS 394.84]|uniref:Uncharacterized protein n=1 Tax=Cucurbitaria berberidis CBS 394.84 TaxID=1168544 RepID=A0A9P4GJ02_9PLEO|nr:uncharacterized protein K460DRAFT_406682 [Cucurbitaria berberidis CBS 394.84]KAF1846480.1 hypothetical protein K460DRAFT_406682 [Cucurbitaria berberidis CBS 394.84]